MADLYGSWRSRVEVNSQRAVEVYTQELPDFRTIANNSRARAAMVDFAVYLRERTVALAAEGKPFTDRDLAFIASVGRNRGAAGVSLASQRRVLLLHTSLTLREVHEAAGPHDIDPLMHALGWLPPQGLAAQAAYTQGYLLGQETRLPVVDRVRLLTGMLLADDPVAPDLAANLAMGLPGPCVVAVARFPEPLPRPRPPRADILQELLARHWIPLGWDQPDELVALVSPREPASAEDRTLTVMRDFWQQAGLPCAVGAARGQVGELATTVAQAREVSRVAPIRALPGEVCYTADVFPELEAARNPVVDQWLRAVAHRLADGPHLVATLDAFYRNDMRRLQTAASLRIHPRTLDYRLERIQDRTGLDPGSVRGVRVLSSTVTRVLAGAWD